MSQEYPLYSSAIVRAGVQKIFKKTVFQLPLPHIYGLLPSSETSFGIPNRRPVEY